MLSGNEYEKYYETKKLISTAVAAGKIRTIDLGTATSKQLQTAILSHSQLMLHPNRFYNYGRVTDGINIQANQANLRMLLPVSTHVNLNVDFFANAFHLDAAVSDLAVKKVDYFPDLWQYSTAHTVVQADFDDKYLDPRSWDIGDVVPVGTMAVAGATDATKVYDASRIVAVILDSRALVINPVLPTQLSTISNPMGRNTNIILNEKAYFSYSPFMPACVILADYNPDASTTP